MPAAFLTSMQVCPFFDGPIPHVGGPIIETTADNIIVVIFPMAAMGSTAICVGPPATVLDGSPTFIADFTPAGIMLASTDHGGVVVEGEPTMIV